MIKHKTTRLLCAFLCAVLLTALPACGKKEGNLQSQTDPAYPNTIFIPDGENTTQSTVFPPFPPSTEPAVTPTPDNPTPDIPDDPPVKPELPETPFITLAHVPLATDKGDLILVNRDHRFDPALAATDLVIIKKAITDPTLAADLIVARYEMYLTAKTVDALARLSHDMQTALGSDKNIHIYSAYRDEAYQQGIIDDYLNKPGYGQSYVDNYVAPVGASEHHTGMAVDMNLYGDDGTTYRFTDEAVKEEYAWILQNAPKYGLIWRYTEEKKEFTGYSEEIWHFRFVGAPHAEYMTVNNYCLEEYHALLQKTTYDDPLVITTMEGQTYSIYIDDPYDGLQVPQSIAYTVSGSNCGYYVVTTAGTYKGAGIIYTASSDQVKLSTAPDMGQVYTEKLTFLADSQISTLKDSALLPPSTQKIGRVWVSATEHKLNFKYINTMAVMVDTKDSDRYWISNTIAQTAENFSPQILVLAIGLDGGINREYQLTDSEIYDIWRGLVQSILDASPDTIVILQSVLPLGQNVPEEYAYTTNDAILRFNSTMLHVATEMHGETKRVFYLDTASVMTDAQGYLKTSYSDDGVSLNHTGLSVMMHYIRTHPYVQ